MIIRSRAPLRIGLAGGGTDVSPYCDDFGGVVLNATVNMYANCTIEPTNDGKIIFDAVDRSERFECEATSYIEIDDILPLHKGIYNRVVKDFNNGNPLSFKMTTYADAPAGSGLGTSSTVVVSILKAFEEWLKLPLGEYDLARLAYEIERNDLSLSGGKQDQYAATFGGFNFIEFYDDNRVIVNPLRIKNWIRTELESSIILYYTGQSRDSAKIIDEQIKNTNNKNSSSIEAMHELKKSAYIMKEAVLRGEFGKFAECLKMGWEAKKKTASVISNSKIEESYELIMKNGGLAAKVSGAGGGGFMMIYCDPIKRTNLINILNETDGKVMEIQFTDRGSEGWIIY
ncbi:dehydrogenase [Clostridium botulinum]|uniref:GHMP family kinase ATP-binding protein n=1 Tax=Clostridium botulinum TaxID=1491 RepID=UPI0019672005|nr:dehydrogenase [Clostridium botulinum]MBN1075623.1 dehydrogenase [Clostridium botulinum]